MLAFVSIGAIIHTVFECPEEDVPTMANAQKMPTHKRGDDELSETPSQQDLSKKQGPAEPPTLADTSRSSQSFQELLLNLQSKLGGPIFVVWGYLYENFFEAVLRLVKRSGTANKLNLLVNSLGGDPNRAFLGATALRERFTEITVHIPREAMSAAHLLGLAANEMVLYTGSRLGPLDMQVADPRSSTQLVSALSGKRALDSIATFLHDEIDVLLRHVISRTGANIADSLDFALQYVASIARPFFEQLSPLDLGNFVTSQEVNRRYATELLTRNRMPKAKADEIAEKLVNGYPDHSFVIGIVEATRLGLSVRRPTPDETNVVDIAYEILKTNFKTSEYFGLLKDIEFT